jgi:hypothetical protein
MNRNSIGYGAEDAQTHDLGYGFFAPALFLFRLDRGVGDGLWLAGMVN